MQITTTKAYSFHQMGNRQNQEDARFPDSDSFDSNFLVVCDGVGGCDAGEIASETIAQSIGLSLQNYDWNAPFTNDSLSEILTIAYDNLEAAKTQGRENMATTMTMVVTHANGVTMAHIGDSRIYQFRPGEGIHFKTRDHSLVAEMVSKGKITEEEARDHPQNNIITRSMSATKGDRCPATTLTTTDVKAGDVFMLCTDGVLSMCRDEELTDIFLSDMTDEEKIQSLASMSCLSSDNNTASFFTISEVIYDDDEAEEESENICIDVAPAAQPDFFDKISKFFSELF